MGVTCAVRRATKRKKRRELGEEVVFSLFLSFDGLLVGWFSARFGAVVFGRLLGHPTP